MISQNFLVATEREIVTCCMPFRSLRLLRNHQHRDYIIQQVTNLARQMVTRFGMSNIGPMALEDENTGQVFLTRYLRVQSEVLLTLQHQRHVEPLRHS